MCSSSVAANRKKNTIEYVGFKPYLHQSDVINLLVNDSKHKHRTVTVVSKRQVGKSLMAENLLLYFGINFARTTSICVSPTLAQARKLFKEIVEAVEDSDIIKSSNATLLELELVNRSQILFKSAEQREALRGFTVTGICIIDESAYVEDSVYYTILPWVDVSGAPILLISTPRVRSGFFFDNYCRGLEGKNEFYTVDWSNPKYKPELDKLLSPERLEEYRKILPKSQFASEYLGQFLDQDGVVFQGFKECVHLNRIEPSDRLFWGIDWANGGDNDDTVITAINQNGKQVYLQYWNNLTPTQQIDKLQSILRRYESQTTVIQPELNSIGTPYTDSLKQQLSPQLASKVHGFTTTNQSKNDIVAQLQVAFEKREIEILDDERQLMELGSYSMEYNPRTHTVTYNAPNGLHDDLCIGLMLAWDAYHKRTLRGNYSIGFAR